MKLAAILAITFNMNATSIAATQPKTSTSKKSSVILVDQKSTTSKTLIARRGQPGTDCNVAPELCVKWDKKIKKDLKE